MFSLRFCSVSYQKPLILRFIPVFSSIFPVFFQCFGKNTNVPTNTPTDICIHQLNIVIHQLATVGKLVYFSILIGVPTVPALSELSVALKYSPGIGYIYLNIA